MGKKVNVPDIPHAEFNFRVESMNQPDADSLWDRILEMLESMGYERAVVGTYKVEPNLFTTPSTIEMVLVGEKGGKEDAESN